MTTTEYSLGRFHAELDGCSTPAPRGAGLVTGSGHLPASYHLRSERWRPVPGWPYEVSSYGRVRTARRGEAKILLRQERGRVILYSDGCRESFAVEELQQLAGWAP